VVPTFWRIMVPTIMVPTAQPEDLYSLVTIQRVVPWLVESFKKYFNSQSF
jgi:hypothetical protein